MAHVVEIRRTKYSIGGEPNPLSEDLHQAVMNLSAELYAKDVHFLMELIQNAEDNEYPEGVDSSLEFVITSKDIRNTGAPATLLAFNNEKGFSSKDIDSIYSAKGSTKKGLPKPGYIGRKRRRAVTEAKAKSKSDKFSPPHQDAVLRYPSHNGGPTSFTSTNDNSFGSSIFESKSSRSVKEPESSRVKKNHHVSSSEPSFRHPLIYQWILDSETKNKFWRFLATQGR